MNNRSALPDMTSFFISPRNLSIWMRQNRAAYTGDYVAGTLLDNFVLSCKRGYAAVYEHSLNCWTSDYRVEFQPGKAQDIWNNWHKFEDAARKLHEESKENYQTSNPA